MQADQTGSNFLIQFPHHEPLPVHLPVPGNHMISNAALAAAAGYHFGLPAADIIAGLHPKAGGDGSVACSGDMLLQALVTCAGTTMAAVSTAMGLEIRGVRIEARGRMDFRGTLGVDRTVPVGLTSIELQFHIESDVLAESLDKLIQLTERYCVVLQTLQHSVQMTSTRA